jgi:NAD-dependent DNA ligase
LTDGALTKILNDARLTSDYELDGIVIDINEASARSKATDSGIPTTVKYKVADASNYAVTSVKEVVYRASKDAYLKPRVNIHPVQLMGVTVNFATGFNAKFIKDNKIGPGAKIRITRSGDVIPYILNTVEPATPQLPDPKVHGDWHWTENDQGERVDAVLDSALNNKGVTVLKLKDIFTKLKIPHLKEGSLDKLYDAGFTTFESIVNAEYTDLYLVLGQNGAKIDQAMDEILDGIYWPELVGSLNIFGRGISRKSMTTLYDSFQGDIEKMRDPALICEVEGFDIKTAQKIADNIDTALELINKVSDRVKPSTYTAPSAPVGDRMIGQSVVFTGVRSAEVEKAIIEQGGELKSTISSKVTILVCKDVNSNSGKAKKARQLGIKVVDIKGMEKLLYS